MNFSVSQHNIALDSWIFSAHNVSTHFLLSPHGCIVTDLSKPLHFVSLSLCSRGTDSRQGRPNEDVSQNLLKAKPDIIIR